MSDGLHLFNDAHSFLHNVTADIETAKGAIEANDKSLRDDQEQLRKEIEQERFERRDALNKLRYEFEEFVHRKIDKVLSEVEDMKRVERHGDDTQQQQLDSLVSDLDRLKENLFSVQSSWGKLVSNCLTPNHMNDQTAGAAHD
eukprot:gnl/MRDRNA2_/MRDRNA2_82893_c0_seq1.p2 gnl/MRDRNA2_/MRDRNA2_82893_c0~~gnl/MRDRNA2_/MRDRNA2_82893_c0_seq1.p2  ORF type:complete len:143 (-),score=39.34 gnl/MRDRNA2_/MRDRNA2_82893_c0_seq1:300-728(-)